MQSCSFYIELIMSIAFLKVVLFSYLSSIHYDYFFAVCFEKIVTVSF